MKNLVNYAVSYAERGFSVIPTIAKKPLKKFAGLPAMTPDEIRNFWKSHPYANIALKTDKFFVIDIDRHKDGADGVAEIKKLGHTDWFHDTLAQRTAHNGFQYFFQKPADVKIQQNIAFLPGVDIKAHVNNYVVVAPSVVDDKPYQWISRTGTMKRPDDGLLKLIQEKSKPVYQPHHSYSTSFTGKTQTTELFEQIITGLGETGGRNNALAVFVGGLLRRNVDPEIAYNLALIANKNTEKSLSTKEVERTVQSIVTAELRRREGNDGNSTQ
ncbi:bifunctional DNA primase/polymerase [Ligilactobacillus ruminis]|uniref:bifunctional DNA primase/polymerase n=1 Tax=Ligilactobacillus ruminis TaxID=1623 RepID=UPI002330642F|nr:bifunctional DNA primase/polymerase [Ligilactobacillus ruminis]MDB7642427.1 bifunctional DNA primase/polymerase [Ligilactobacillus ruminis]MDB7647015.1 bifunctional DNA primase/polymerase [Ligilactobacillus ruminis]MDB7649023.1 bifunctional DNA primase/polymerase [Ligilactobacillus ruminis]